MRKILIIFEILIVLTAFMNFASATVNPPTNVHATLSGTNMSISWTKSTTTNVTQYRIHIYNINNSNTIISSLTKYVDANTTSTSVTVPFANNCYTAHVPAMVSSTNMSSSIVSNIACNAVVSSDTIPPKSITGLKNVSFAKNYINWTWTDPADSDFSKVMVYIDGTFKTNITKGIRFYNTTNNFSSLTPDTDYKISTRTVDTTGNVNSTWVNATNRTAPDIMTIPSSSSPLMASLTNIVLTVTASGGTPPYTYRWTGIPTLPTPCPSGISTNTIICNPTNPGTYNMTVTITDANNNVVTISNNITVDSPPAPVLTQAVTDLNNITYAQNYINWTWTNPKDPGFGHVEIYVDNGPIINVSNDQYYNKIGLLPNTEHTIHVRTVDINRNVNLTWVNGTSITARDDVPPNSIAGLRNVSYAQNYINWTWNNPNDTDFDHVDIYINNGPIISVGKNQSYNATGLVQDTEYTIHTRTVDTSENFNDTLVNNTARTANQSIPSSGGENGILQTISFVTIGDTHITSNTNSQDYQNFTRAINYINNNMKDVDFVVELGDITNDAQPASFIAANSILNSLNKSIHYYVVEGNHDIGSPSGANFRTYVGPTEHIESFKGYQLIFPSIDYSGTTFSWSFDYSTANKSKPTLIFNHGPIGPTTSTNCGWSSYYGYSCNASHDMRIETGKFSNLLGFYAGHVHTWTQQPISTPTKDTLYITEEGLGGASNSIYIGHTVIYSNRTVTYERIKY